MKDFDVLFLKVGTGRPPQHAVADHEFQPFTILFEQRANFLRWLGVRLSKKAEASEIRPRRRTPTAQPRRGLSVKRPGQLV
jgi:hypothetical protein